MGKKSSKNVHKKKSYREKHKKGKKKHTKHKKYKKSRKSSESSDSDTVSNSSSSYESDNKQQLKEKKIPVKKDSNYESEWDEIFSDKNTISKVKTNEKKTREVFEHPDYAARELNPYWKNGGNGLPPCKDFEQTIDSNNVDSLKLFLERAKTKAFNTGLPLEKIVQNEWGPLEKLTQLIDKMENEKSQELNCNEMKNTKKVKYNFLKPGELHNVEFMKTYKRNWKKRELNCDEVPEVLETSNVEEKQSEICKTKTILTADELNALVAKALKAEIMGDKVLAEKLREEVEVAKKHRNESSASKEIKREKNTEETVILTKTNLKGVTRPLDDQNCTNFTKSSKRLKVETHKGNERLRYFMDDDKHSLKSMFEKEKFGSSSNIDEALYRAGRKNRNNDDNEMDEAFIDEIRRGDFERRETEKERNRNMDEAKSKHKSLNRCQWCLDGSNSEKNLVISIGAKCYLCLPGYESLTNGHCLIVPIQHDSCGTLLDEDVWDEMQTYRQNLCKMFEDEGKDVIFFETARSFHRFPHMILHCVPVDKETGDSAPIYFKKAILESESEWSNNKKLIELAGKGLRRSIPKGLTYFTVSFGREDGFAHIIEDEKLFPQNFAEEIIAGMMDLEPAKWRKRRKESFDVQKEKVFEFSRKWQKYELNLKKRRRFSSDSVSSE